MQSDPTIIRGRGSVGNPANRFEQFHLERDPDWNPAEDPAPATRFFNDATSSIITYNDSPDVGFEASINPYRGCEHGCAYCYARPTHEYLGFSAGLDFESKILVKRNAPQLLRRELSSPSWKPKVLAMSGVTDPYQPVERRLKITRGCLEVLAEFRNPVVIVTKNHLVTRDLDLLADLATNQAATVLVSVTTLDCGLAQTMEPRASLPNHRLAAIKALASAGVPAGVMVAPVIPGLTDHEMPAIITAAAEAGARFAGYVVLRLPHGVAPLFDDWLTRHVPGKKEKVLGRIRAIRGGKLNDPQFGSRMEGQGIFAEQIASLFTVACRKAGMNERGASLSTASFRRPSGDQLQLFS
ncbi:MAG: PA0069 family radical SAM protein [Verrucomicrobiota bacterium]